MTKIKTAPNLNDSSSVNLWKYELDDVLNQTISAGNFIVAYNAEGNLVIINILTGKGLTWSIPNFNNTKLLGYGNGVLLISNSENELVAFRLSDIVVGSSELPTPLWSSKSIPDMFPCSATINEFKVYNNTFSVIYTVFQQGENQSMITSFYTATGSPAWINQSPDSDALEASRFPLTGSNGQAANFGCLCIGDDAFYVQLNGTLTAYNTDFGDKRFPNSTIINPPTPVSISQTQVPWYSSESILAVGADNTIKGLDLDTGSLLWSFPNKPDNTVWKIGSVSTDLSLVIVFNKKGEIQLLNTKTGKPIWQNNLQLPNITSVEEIQAVITPTELQLLPLNSTTIYSVDLLATKPLLSPFSFPEGNGSVKPILINGAIIYLQKNNHLVAIPVDSDEQAAYFDGITNKVNFTNSTGDLNFRGGDFTIECWMRTLEGGELLNTTAEKGAATLRLNVSAGGKFALAIFKSDNDYDCVMTENTNAADGYWHHIAIVKKSIDTLLYLDGHLVDSFKIRYYNNVKYYNDTYKLTTPISGKIIPQQLSVDEVLPPQIILENQTGLNIGWSLDEANAFKGLLREVRLWKNAVSVDKLNNRRFKILGPLQSDNTGKENPIKGKEPKLIVNLHLDTNYGIFPANVDQAQTNTDLRNDIVDFLNWKGTYTKACSCPTNLELSLSGFPYLLDKDVEEWPYSEHWAARGEHEITTNPVLNINTGVICFGANNALYGIRKNDGKSLWTLPLGENFSNPISSGAAFQLLSEGKVLIIDALNGQLVEVTGVSDAKSSFPSVFQSNLYLANEDNYLVYSKENGGVGVMNGTTHIAISPSINNKTSEISIYNEIAYWCDDNNGVIFIVAYDLKNNKQLFVQEVNTFKYAVNSQYLYCITSDGLTVINAINGKKGAVNSSITSSSGIAIDASGNHLILATSSGAVYGLKPATLSINWQKQLSDTEVNNPVIEGRNAYCTSLSGEVKVFDTFNGDLRGEFKNINKVLSPAIVDHGTVYFACDKNQGKDTAIDGALHQIVFGNTNVLELNGASYISINKELSDTPILNFDRFNATNSCIESWVNLKTPEAANIISLTYLDKDNNSTGLELEIDANQKICFQGFQNVNGAQVGLELVSDVNLIPIKRWCHISLNIISIKEAKLYIDGQPHKLTITPYSNTASLSKGLNILMGASLVSTKPSACMNGLLGEVRIWDTNQSVDQLMERMHTKLIGTEADLVAGWNFDMLSVFDVTRNASKTNGYDIKLNSSPSFILNELNFETPNYPYFTYQGLNNGIDENHEGKKYQKYILNVNAHKADGSPLVNEKLLVWHVKTSDESGPETVYITQEDDGSDPRKGLPLKAITSTSQESLLAPKDCYTIETDSNGKATIFVDTFDLKNGPGFDIYAPFLPENERFHVNVLINKQELKKAPPPVIALQSELIRDYKYSTGGKIDEKRRTSVFRAILKAENPDKTVRTGEMVTLYADSQQTIKVDGKKYSINTQNGATFYTDGIGEIIIDAEAKDIKGFELEVWAGFMHKNDRVKFSLAKSGHDRLSSIQPDDITTDRAQYWTGKGVNNSILLKKQYHSSAGKITDSLHHLMAASNPKKKNSKSKLSPPIPVANSAMQQPAGSPMPDKVIGIRTLTYINRKKTMDLDAIKTSVQEAAKKVGVYNAVGFKIDMSPDSTTFGLTYLKKEDLDLIYASSDLGMANPEIIPEGFFSGLWHDVESAAEKAAHAFEDLVHDAEKLVVDLSKAVSVAVSVLNHLGPLGHILADGIEHVMKVVGTILHYIEVTLILMIEFLTLLFEWKHIIATHHILKNGGFSPALAFGSKLLESDYVGDLSTRINAIQGGDDFNIPKVLDASPGDLKTQHNKKHYTDSAHSVKSKSLIHKTKSNSSKARVSGTTKIPNPSSPSFPGNTENLAKSILDKFEQTDFKGSVSSIMSVLKELFDTFESQEENILDILKLPIETVINTALFKPVTGLLEDKIDIPFISALYHFITGDSLTFLDLIALLLAVPVIVVYEAVEGAGKFFDEHCSITIPSFPTLKSTANTTTLINCETTSNKSQKGLIISYIVFQELSVIFRIFADYITKKELELAPEIRKETTENPISGLFRFFAGLTNLTSSALNFAMIHDIYQDLLHNEVLYEQDHEHSKDRQYKKSIEELIALNYIPLISSTLFSIEDMSKIRGFLKPAFVSNKLEKTELISALLQAVVAIIYAVFVVGNYFTLDKDIYIKGSALKSGPKLKKRVELFDIGNVLSSVARCLRLLKQLYSVTFSCITTGGTKYFAVGVTQSLLVSVNVILKAVGELEYADNEEQLIPEKLNKLKNE